MLDSFLATLSPMLVMFLCIVIGYVLRVKKLLPEDAATVMSKLENFVFVPALVLSNFMTNCTVESLSTHYVIVLYSVLALAVALIIAIPLSKLFAKNDYYKRNIYKYALTFGNFAFMGNAIVPAILGQYDSQILYKYLLFTLPLNIAIYTWGIAILIPKGEKKQNPLKNLLNPACISIVIGVLLGITGLTKYVPEFVTTTLDYCKSCMAPVAMILTGFVVGGYSVKPLLSDKKVYIATFLRLFVLPSIILAVLMLCRAPDLVVVLAMFAYATPLGMNTVVFPAAYGGETKTGASMAMISHTLCIITIPIVYTVLIQILR